MSPVWRYRAPPRLAAALAVCLGAGACDQVEDVSDPADPIVVERSNASLQAVVNLAHVANVYRAEHIELDLTPEQVQALAVWGLKIGLESVYSLFDCEAMIDTDDQTYVAATFQGCSMLFLELTGTVRADIEVLTDTESCARDTCPTAIVWRVDSTNFTARNPRQDFAPGFAGIVELTTPLVPGQRMQWDTDPTFEIDLPIGRFYADSTAQWEIDDDRCVTMDLEARLQQIEAADDLEAEIGDVVLSAQNLRQCEDKCPEAGDVNISYGKGEVLQWTYTAESTVLISGPRGRQFMYELPCEN
jgi:hypothetical protein